MAQVLAPETIVPDPWKTSSVVFTSATDTDRFPSNVNTDFTNVFQHTDEYTRVTAVGLTDIYISPATPPPLITSVTYTTAFSPAVSTTVYLRSDITPTTHKAVNVSSTGDHLAGIFPPALLTSVVGLEFADAKELIDAAWNARAAGACQQTIKFRTATDSAVILQLDKSASAGGTLLASTPTVSQWDQAEPASDAIYVGEPFTLNQHYYIAKIFFPVWDAYTYVAVEPALTRQGGMYLTDLSNADRTYTATVTFNLDTAASITVAYKFAFIAIMPSIKMPFSQRPNEVDPTIRENAWFAGDQNKSTPSTPGTRWSLTPSINLPLPQISMAQQWHDWSSTITISDPPLLTPRAFFHSPVVRYVPYAAQQKKTLSKSLKTLAAGPYPGTGTHWLQIFCDSLTDDYFAGSHSGPLLAFVNYDPTQEYIHIHIQSDSFQWRGLRENTIEKLRFTIFDGSGNLPLKLTEADNIVTLRLRFF